MRTTVHFLLTALFASIALPAASTDYYVSKSIGNDAFDGRSGVVSRTVGPFASVKPLQALVLRHGDRVLFHCGERFAGPLRLTLDSQDSGELVLGSYGDCADGAKPVLDGRVPLNQTSTGQLQQFAEAGGIEQVFAGDVPLPRARFPTTGYIILPERAVPSKVSLAGYLPPNGQSVLGAVLHARTEEWYLEEREVTGPNGQLASALEYPLRPKGGFYLTGKPWMMGEKSAWAYDASTRQLFVRELQGAPLFKVPSVHLLELSGRGSVAVVGIAFDAAGGDAINSRLSGAVSVRDVNIQRAMGNGIAIAGASNANILNSTIADVGLDAIFFAETKRVFIRRNRIRNAGLYAGPRPSLAAINAHRTESATIDENIIENSAYIGIRFSGDARIRRNYVRQSCLFLSDCAAIYTWRRNVQDRRPHAEVTGNLIDGAKGDTTVKLGVTDFYAGIYLDEFSNDISVTDNVMVDVNQGIYLHNAYNNEVTNNVIRARTTTLIDAADKIRFPLLVNTANSVRTNDVQLGSFGLLLLNDVGEKRGFSFDDVLHLGLIENNGQAPGKLVCKPKAGLPQPSQDKAPSIWTSIANCV